MPTYHFDLWDGQQVIVDNLGSNLRGPEDAFEEAVRQARNVLTGSVYQGKNTLAWAYRVRNGQGFHIFTVPFLVAPVDKHYGRAFRQRTK